MSGALRGLACWERETVLVPAVPIPRTRSGVRGQPGRVGGLPMDQAAATMQAKKVDAVIDSFSEALTQLLRIRLSNFGPRH